MAGMELSSLEKVFDRTSKRRDFNWLRQQKIGNCDGSMWRQKQWCALRYERDDRYVGGYKSN
jgi:hypothetical protein